MLLAYVRSIYAISIRARGDADTLSIIRGLFATVYVRIG